MRTPPLEVTQQLVDAFSNFRAEHHGAALFAQFTKPGYFPELVNKQPCFLIGGRGTGKTTTLKSLSYKGTFALAEQRIRELDKWDYIGIYIKINTSRVAAFRGPEVTPDQWDKIFGHYLNLLLVNGVIDFLAWYSQSHSSCRQPKDSFIEELAFALSLPPQSDLIALRRSIERMLRDLEIQINSIGDEKHLKLTALGAPLEALLDALYESNLFGDSTIFFLIDEFENLSDYQQRVVNTLIKHARPPYTFKIGVRELGIRQRCTLNASEVLVDPADFRRIDIPDRLTEEASFELFAANVCALRAASAAEAAGIEDRFGQLFESLSAEEEADRLGLIRALSHLKANAKGKLTKQHWDQLEQLGALDQYCLITLEKGDPAKLAAALDSQDLDTIRTRINNNKHALLFTLKTGKSGIRKYYCGWRVLCKLAAGNIRYLLELVHKSLQLHVNEGVPGDHQLVSAEIQTTAAQYIGKKNLRELEGLSVLGARVAKLVLSLGRIFQVMADEPVGHTAEVNQFEVYGDGGTGASEYVRDLLEAAVVHMAIVRRPGTKLQQSEDVRDFEYFLHPTFSAFFGYSYRQKRKMRISYEELGGLTEDPQRFIAQVLKRQNRDPNMQLPDQISLFESYYHGSNV